MRRAALMVGWACALLPCSASAATPDWKSTWGTGVHTIEASSAEETGLNLYVRATFPDLRAHDQTLRQIVRTSIGGEAVRVRLSNAFGDGPLRIGRVTIAVRDGAGSLQGATVRQVRFGGHDGVTIPAGGEQASDPVDLAVAAEQELAISMHVIESPPRPTLHLLALTNSFTSPPGLGDQTGDPSASAQLQTYRHWFWLSGVDVLAPRETGTVVTLGDSITDGAYVSNALVESKDQSWPSRLAARLRTVPAEQFARGVVNVGISGNTVVRRLPAWTGTPAVERFDRDVLARPGVTHVIIYEGTNDLGDGATATELAAGLRNLAERAHARGVRVVGATIAPRRGTPTVPWDAAMEAERQAANGWIRSYPGWDGVVDIDRALQDPASPGQMRPEYDSGDGLHPGPAGRQAIADAVDLDLLRCVARPPETTLARRSVTYRRGRLLVRGASAADRCGGEPVRRVTVTLTKLGARGPATELRARGTEHWRLSRRIALRRGRYRVSARARTAGLTESRSAANTVTLTVG